MLGLGISDTDFAHIYAGFGLWSFMLELVYAPAIFDLIVCASAISMKSKKESSREKTATNTAECANPSRSVKTLQICVDSRYDSTIYELR